MTDLKVVYGTGTGIQGNGAASGVSAITELPFTRDIVTIVKVDAQGAVYLKRETEQIVLKPGESWITQGRGNIPDSTSEERISNYGIFEKSRIQLYKE